jgi:replicative DNA helicase
VTGKATGFVDLDEMTTGLQDGDLIIVAGRPSMGKANPVDTPIRTPGGWKRMGEPSRGRRTGIGRWGRLDRHGRLSAGYSTGLPA